MNFVSESLIFSGAYLLTTNFSWVGFVLISLGVVGGISSFMYNVSLSQTLETRKAMIYADVKSFFESFTKTAREIGINELQKKDTKGTTIH